MSRRVRVIVFFCLAFVRLLGAQAPAPFRFVVIGDSGSGSAAQRRVAGQMWAWRAQHPFDLVLMLGDNIYGNLEITGGGDPRLFPAKFDAFYKRFQDQKVTFHAVIGNHDTQTNHGKAEIDDQRRFGILGSSGYYRFPSPAALNVQGQPLADFFALNSELRDEEMTRQVDWIQQELDKSTAIWKFVFIHHPFYTIRGQRAPAVAFRGRILDSLKRNHVQFILAGHNHFYARMKPVDQILEVISGGGGRHLAFPRSDPCAQISARKYHFVAVEVLPDRVHFTAVDQYGNVFDDQFVDAGFLKSETKGCPVR